LWARLEPIRDFTLLVGSKVEMTESDKHPSLLQNGICYGRKKFYSTGQVCRTIAFFIILFSCEKIFLRLELLLSVSVCVCV
jgi:hypothetical protein